MSFSVYCKRYQDLCYVNPAHHIGIEDIPSIIGCEPITTFKKLCSLNLPPLGGKGYFAAVGTFARTQFILKLEIDVKSSS